MIPNDTESIRKIQKCLRDISDVGINIGRLTEAVKVGDGPLTGMVRDVGQEDRREAFFAQAKLWHVIREIIETLFIDDLVEGRIKLRYGNHNVAFRDLEGIEESAIAMREKIDKALKKLKGARINPRASLESTLLKIEEVMNDLDR